MAIVKAQAKVWFSKLFVLSWFVLLLHAFCMHTMNITKDSDGVLITFDVFDYHRTVVLMNN